MKFVIDAGHGGKDPGAKATVGNAVHESDYEKRHTILICQALTNHIFAAGHLAFLTRVGDHFIPLTDRLDFNERIAPKAFLSIHCNASDNRTARGTEVLYRHPHSHTLATYISDRQTKALEPRNRGPRDDTDYLGKSLTVLNADDIPSVLIEVGFLTNVQDLNALRDFQTVAGAIWTGLQRWIIEEG